jgi:hypothetical protein
MPCNASYARFIFGKFFTSTIILYILLFAQNFYSCKKWVLQSGGDAQVLLQSSKPAGENWRFDPEGLQLIRISVHLLILGVARGRVLFIGLVFYILVLRLLLFLNTRVLSRCTLRNHQLYLKRLIFL